MYSYQLSEGKRILQDEGEKALEDYVHILVSCRNPTDPAGLKRAMVQRIKNNIEHDRREHATQY